MSHKHKLEYAGINYDCYLKYVKSRSGREYPRVYCRSIEVTEKPPDWQMTREEFANAIRQETLESMEKLAREGMIEREKKNWGKSLVEHTIKKLKSQSGTQGVKMQLHKNAVLHALQEEKPVPDRVLKEYPDLKQAMEERASLSAFRDTGELWK